MLTRQPLWIAVLVLVAFVLAPISVTFTKAVAMPSLPKDAEQIDGAPIAECVSGPLLKYLYKQPNGTGWVVLKAPNKRPALMVKYEPGKPPVVYVDNEELSIAEAAGRYPEPCDILGVRG
jgi:hypothetical protein